MTPGEQATIIIVSDLHLAAGTDAISGRRDPLEPFSQDAAFARWLDYFQDPVVTSGSNPRLLLLGDIFDFPRVRLAGVTDDSASGAGELAIAKLDHIAAGHPAVFAAFGRWLGAGRPIDIVPGNHDFELMRPAVFDHLSALLAREAGLDPQCLPLKVSPWIFHIPGLLYAEHGQQYHDLNSFPALVRMETQRPSVTNLPLGAALDTFVQNVTSRLGPEVDAPDSIGRLFRNVAGTGPLGVVRIAPDIARLAVVIGRDFIARQLPGHRARREDYRAEVVAAQAAITGIPGDVLVKIDQVAESAANRLFRRVAGLLLRRSNRASDGNSVPANYLVQAASHIRDVLEEAGIGSAFYVFGHSHRAEQRFISGDAPAAVYLNSGAWAWQADGLNTNLTFVRVTLDSVQGEATGALYRWNDHLGQIELVQTPARMPVDTATPGLTES